MNTAAATDAPPQPGGLDERDRQILAFERQWWKYAGSKEQAVHDLFGLSATRYYQVLNGLLDNPAALAHDPMLVKRLRRLPALGASARDGDLSPTRPQTSKPVRDDHRTGFVMGGSDRAGT